MASAFQWFQDWRIGRADAAALARCGHAELARIAGDVGLNVGALTALARKGPHAADLLSSRLASLGLDEDVIGRSMPAVVQDLQRVCAFCESKRRCKHDLDGSSVPWPDYCPNSQSLRDLVLDIAANAGREAGWQLPR